jgi:hypothetical protein
VGRSRTGLVSGSFSSSIPDASRSRSLACARGSRSRAAPTGVDVDGTQVPVDVGPWQCPRRREYRRTRGESTNPARSLLHLPVANKEARNALSVEHAGRSRAMSPRPVSSRFDLRVRRFPCRIRGGPACAGYMLRPRAYLERSTLPVDDTTPRAPDNDGLQLAASAPRAPDELPRRTEHTAVNIRRGHRGPVGAAAAALVHTDNHQGAGPTCWMYPTVIATRASCSACAPADSVAEAWFATAGAAAGAHPASAIQIGQIGSIRHIRNVHTDARIPNR